MARPPRRTAWLEALTKHLDEAGPRVITLADIGAILADRGRSIGVPKSATSSKVVSILLAEGGLRQVDLRLEAGKRRAKKRVLVWREVSAYRLGASVRRESYLSHMTALFLHGLLDKEPEVIYANREQGAKAKPGRILSQDAIDRAFKGRPRVSRYAVVWGDHRIVLLSGKNTGGLGVNQLRFGDEGVLATTSVERTMVDIAVRPSYAGGAKGVLEAYRAAKGLVDVEGIAEMLRGLQHTYPYHQSIGYFLERAGYPEDDLKYLEGTPIEWNFYIEYGGQDLELNSRWQVYHPRTM